MPIVAKTPPPPYYAVIFTSQRTDGDNGYDAMAEEMVRLASRQKGFLGVESVRNTEGTGITVSYWATLDAIQKFKAEARHRQAQQMGKETWYSTFGLRVCKVERDTLSEAL
jgi:heme-degrading monooxygenase HmoA